MLGNLLDMREEGRGVQPVTLNSEHPTTGTETTVTAEHSPVGDEAGFDHHKLPVPDEEDRDVSLRASSSNNDSSMKAVHADRPSVGTGHGNKRQVSMQDKVLKMV